LEQVQLSVSLVIYNSSAESISGLLADIDSIPLAKNLYVYDNSQQKTDLSSVLKEYAQHIHTGENIGYGAGHNECIKKAEGSTCHLVVNPDVRFDGADIVKLYEKACSSDKIGLIIPSVYYEDGSFQYIYKLLPDPLTLFSRYGAKFLPKSFVKKQNFNYEMRFKDFTKEFELPVVSGCFMFGRTEVFTETGGFDDRFFMYMEDVDLSRRVSMKYKNLYFPDLKITHHFNKSSFKNFRIMTIHIKSAVQYFNKWGWFFDKYRKKVNMYALKND